MAELPHIGKHCDVAACSHQDFLPVKCDACRRTFCGHHVGYDKHECSEAYQKNVQVPVCSLCNKPVPTPRGVSADVQVNAHIERNCGDAPLSKTATAVIVLAKESKTAAPQANAHIQRNCANRPLSKTAVAAIARAKESKTAAPQKRPKEQKKAEKPKAISPPPLSKAGAAAIAREKAAKKESRVPKRCGCSIM